MAAGEQALPGIEPRDRRAEGDAVAGAVDEEHVGEVQVRRVVSRLVDLAPRVAGLRMVMDEPLRTPVAVARFLAAQIGAESQEVFVAVLLDGSHRVTGVFEVSRGTLTSSLVHPREVFGPALRLGAAALLVAHNHPSGRTRPSPEDLALTRRLIEAGRLLGVPLLDHLIFGGADRWRSLRLEGGAWNEST
ncbi:MAG: JAB domain-containing protein [Planctomycetota bacterium]